MRRIRDRFRFPGIRETRVSDIPDEVQKYAPRALSSLFSPDFFRAIWESGSEQEV